MYLNSRNKKFKIIRNLIVILLIILSQISVFVYDSYWGFVLLGLGYLMMTTEFKFIYKKSSI